MCTLCLMLRTLLYKRIRRLLKCFKLAYKTLGQAQAQSSIARNEWKSESPFLAK
jgi:hypothetical protein